jgi:hypothetical protein
MKLLRTFLPLLALLTAPAAALAAPAPLLPFETAAPTATPPSLYSFVDVYRLALSGEPFQGPRDGLRFADSQVHARSVSRLSDAEAAEAPPELHFSVSAPRDSGRWPLVLAGLFACVWVAHRRLTSPY